MTPTVSIIVPVYNAEKYLIDCLNSLSAQTYEDFEVVLVDDGSTDRSPDILHARAAEDARFRCFRTENHGVSHARNVGMEKARGDYFCFVDADDFVAKEFLSVLLNGIGNAAACVTAKKRWVQRIGMYRIDSCPSFRGSPAALKKRLWRYRRLMRGCTGRLYLASVIRENDLQFDEALRYGEDMTFNYLVFKYCREVRFVNRVLYTYRIDNPYSLSRLDRTSTRRLIAMQNECIASTFGDL